MVYLIHWHVDFGSLVFDRGEGFVVQKAARSTDDSGKGELIPRVDNEPEVALDPLVAVLCRVGTSFSRD